ncbi:MAG: hypothetical protein EOM69_03525 [Clostridia bacterium]|nr:hypothetical protein [Clostridia bacterium]
MHFRAPKSCAPHPAPQGPIHPGLDLETFQQNIGLTGAQTPQEEQAPQPAAPPVFVPSFYQELPEPQRAKGGLSALAQKARTLMGTPSDDEHQPTIRDLQTTVDFKTAFHAPVLPKRAEHHEEE